MKTSNSQRPKKPKKTPQDHARIKPRSLTNRSRITNSMGLLPSVDGRCTWARRMHDLLYLHLSDLGGEDNCSEAEKALARRASCLIVELEHLEIRFAGGEATPRELDLYQRLTNTLRRLLESLGLGRRAKDITPPNPLDYARDYARRKALEAEEAEEVTA